MCKSIGGLGSGNTKQSCQISISFSTAFFSLTVFTENIFENVAQRHLCGGHTHLFTDSSIDYLIQHFRLRELGRWYFGTDIADLIRSYQVELAQKNLNENLQSVFRLKLESMLDELQLVVDKKALWIRNTPRAKERMRELVVTIVL